MEDKASGQAEDPDGELNVNGKPIVMTIVVDTNGKVQVNFPFLKDKVLTYGFLKMAEKTIDSHYANLQESKITIPTNKDFENKLKEGKI